MGDTWLRRPKRRGRPHGHQKHLGYSRRACCDTHGREPHASGCQRHPRMCGDKAAFDTRGQAAEQAASLAGETNLEWRGYRCPSCELFHLTTMVEETP